jgi:hypothetical protein
MIKFAQEYMKNTQEPQRLRDIIHNLLPNIMVDIVAFALFGWAIYFNFTDTSGWSGLVTVPVLFAVGVLSVGNTIALITLTVKSPMRKQKYACLLAILITLLPIIITTAYIAVGTIIERQAEERSSRPITLTQARDLVSTCQVEAILLQDKGKLRLNAYTPILLENYSVPEQRIFDAKYYDELFRLARQKDVEDRCGFVPTYDDRRPKQPPVKKWITQAEAEAILDKCLWNTRFSTDPRYLTEADYPAEPMTTGILLEQRLSVWNDDTESEITVVKVDDSTLTALQNRQKAACAAKSGR